MRNIIHHLKNMRQSSRNLAVKTRRRFSVRFVFLHLFFFIFISGWSCAIQIPSQPDEQLERPTGLFVTALSGGKFRLTYYIQNGEDIFDGYNLYISRYSTGDYSLQENRQPYTLDGSFPTFQHSKNDVNLNNPMQVILDFFMETYYDVNGNMHVNYIPFEVGATYYFKLKAHSIYNSESNFSNEVSAIAIN